MNREKGGIAERSTFVLLLGFQRITCLRQLGCYTLTPIRAVPKGVPERPVNHDGLLDFGIGCDREPHDTLSLGDVVASKVRASEDFAKVAAERWNDCGVPVS